MSPPCSAMISSLIRRTSRITGSGIRLGVGLESIVFIFKIQSHAPVPVISGREFSPDKRKKSLVDQGFSPGRVRGSGGWRGWREGMGGFPDLAGGSEILTYPRFLHYGDPDRNLEF